jgi:hypothetical protein
MLSGPSCPPPLLPVCVLNYDVCCRSDPLFPVILMLGIVCIFKTYPSLGDFALWHALLATYSELNHCEFPSSLTS